MPFSLKLLSLSEMPSRREQIPEMITALGSRISFMHNMLQTDIEHCLHDAF